jgi:hypothetical protein
LIRFCTEDRLFQIKEVLTENEKAGVYMTAAEIAVAINMKPNGIYKFLTIMEQKKMIKINHKTKPVVIKLAKKVDTEIRKPAAVFKPAESLIKSVKIGDVIEMHQPYDREIGGNEKMKKYKVVAIYPYHVVVEDKLGIRRSINYGELIQRGLEKQSPELEALRC